MKNEINVADIIASVTQEADQKKALHKTAGHISLRDRISGSNLSKTAEEAKYVADNIAAEIGKETLTLSAQLEKVAEEMENAETTEDIIKIAASLDNSDFAHLSTMAKKIADVVFADLQNKLAD